MQYKVGNHSCKNIKLTNAYCMQYCVYVCSPLPGRHSNTLPNRNLHRLPRRTVPCPPPRRWRGSEWR